MTFGIELTITAIALLLGIAAYIIWEYKFKKYPPQIVATDFGYSVDEEGPKPFYTIILNTINYEHLPSRLVIRFTHSLKQHYLKSLSENTAFCHLPYKQTLIVFALNHDNQETIRIHFRNAETQDGFWRTMYKDQDNHWRFLDESPQN